MQKDEGEKKRESLGDELSFFFSLSLLGLTAR